MSKFVEPAKEGMEAAEKKAVARTKLNVRWDQVKPGDLIDHPWPAYRYLVGSLIEVTSIEIVGDQVKFSTPAGGDSRLADSLVEVTRDV